MVFGEMLMTEITKVDSVTKPATKFSSFFELSKIQMYEFLYDYIQDKKYSSKSS